MAKQVSNKKPTKIIKYHRGFHVNIGIIVFIIIFIYLIFNVYSYATAKHITFFEVDNGSIRLKTDYTALALREEQLYYAGEAGFVNYYLKDNSKMKKGSLVCSIDENGMISDKIADAHDNPGALNAESMKTIISQIENYNVAFQDMEFYQCYTFKPDLKAELMEAVNLTVLNSMSEYAANAEADNTFHRQFAAQAGIVSYYVDGYEAVTPENFTPGMLNQSGYEKTNLKALETISEGDPIYKVIGSEDWHMIIEVDEEVYKLLAEDSVVEIRFKSDDTTAYANYEFVNKSGINYMVLSLTNSMIRYASDRFIEIELLLNQQTGLKISNTAIVNKDFYAVPKEYFQMGGDSTSEGIIIENYTEEGTVVQEFLTTSVFESDEEFNYIWDERISTGTKVLHPQGQDYYIIKKTRPIQGVYNINKGYAVFRKVDIKYQNEEYAIVEKGTPYGVSMYDHIALDGNLITDGEIIH